MNIESLSAAQLRKAATVKDKIDTLQSELSKLLGSSASTVSNGASNTAGKRKRTMSAAARAALSRKMTAVWNKRKAAAAKK
jgi:hypothetical protein